jgi:hypothetical protein
LAVVLAEAAGRRDVWAQALRGWNVTQSQQVLEWMAEGEAKGRIETLLGVLRLRFGNRAPELEAAVRATSDLALLDRWVDAAVTSSSLDDFRQSANF